MAIETCRSDYETIDEIFITSDYHAKYTENTENTGNTKNTENMHHLIVISEDDEADFFNNVYLQFMRDVEEERRREGRLTQQLSQVRAIKYIEFTHSSQIPEIMQRKVEKNQIQNTGEKLKVDLSTLERDKKKVIVSILGNEIEGPDLQTYWRKGAYLMIGDSTLNGTQQELMGQCYKVRAFPGAIIKDFYDYAIPLLLWKNALFVILVAGTNDVINKSSKCILEELLQLKMFLQLKLTNCEVIMSWPTYRFVEPKAQITLNNYT